MKPIYAVFTSVVFLVCVVGLVFLFTQNQSLHTQLNESQNRVTQLQEQLNQRDAEIAQLKTKVVELTELLQTGDPVATVKEVMAAVTNNQLEKMADFACTAQKDQVANLFNPAVQLAKAGIDADTAKQLLESMDITLTHPEFTTTSESGDTAVVAMKGKLTIKIDHEKLKVVVAARLKSQGMDATDESVNQELDRVDGRLKNSIDIDSSVDLVKENGKWVICDPLTKSRPRHVH